jgi:predicted nucleic acid-binding protein
VIAEAPLVVVDASVAVKWFVSDGEDGVTEADELLGRHIEGEVRLTAPSLLAHEVLNVLRRPGRGAPALPDAMGALFETGILFVPPDQGLMIRAAELVAECGLSTFDAAYVALAETLGCELVTADRRLEHAIADRLSIDVRRIENILSI